MVLQELILKNLSLWSLAKYKGESKFSTWLYTITYNTCLDRIRKNKRAQPLLAIDDYTEQQITLLDNTLDSMEAKERKQMIQDCLALLPGEDSFLLTLFYFEEQSVKEIAKIMGTNPNHVKIKLYRSRKKLTTVLKTNLQTQNSVEILPKTAIEQNHCYKQLLLWQELQKDNNKKLKK